MPELPDTASITLAGPTERKRTIRPSKRNEILDAAIRVGSTHGARAMTLEAVAEAAGITRGGMTYHFREREALDLAVQERLAETWEARLKRVAGAEPDELSLRERTLAYAEVALEAAEHGEIRLYLEAARSPGLRAPWLTLQARWAPSLEDAMTDPEHLRCFVVRLAADGLWAHGPLSGDVPDASSRTALRDALHALLSLDERDR